MSEPGSHDYDHTTDAIGVWAIILFGIPISVFALLVFLV
jgi:hypothetical protein